MARRDYKNSGTRPAGRRGSPFKLLFGGVLLGLVVAGVMAWYLLPRASDFKPVPSAPVVQAPPTAIFLIRRGLTKGTSAPASLAGKASGKRWASARSCGTLTASNGRAEAMAPLVAAGATACGSPREVAGQVEVVFTNVSDTPDVEEVVLGPNGIVHGARPGLVVIDNSTISPSATRRKRSLR